MSDNSLGEVLHEFVNFNLLCIDGCTVKLADFALVRVLVHPPRQYTTEVGFAMVTSAVSMCIHTCHFSQ